MNPIDAGRAWLLLLDDILNRGEEVAPRGKRTLELPQKTIVLDANRPVVFVPDRRLNFRFMAAEAFWILSGDDRVSTIAPFNQRIAEFSDDGVTFFGAYGPRIASQIGYVVEKLIEDQSSRQAGLTIWRECPPKTKDVPCTVSIFFSIRPTLAGVSTLNVHVFMRSSDAWLGIPYDVFTFSMLGHFVRAWLAERGVRTDVGRLFLTAASSHLYEEHFDQANEMVARYRTTPRQREVPRFTRPELLERLALLRHSKPRDPLRWWEE